MPSRKRRKKDNRKINSSKFIIVAIFFAATFFACADITIASEADGQNLESLRASVFDNRGAVLPENNRSVWLAVKDAGLKFLDIEKGFGESVGNPINRVVMAYDWGGKMLAASVNESVCGVSGMLSSAGNSVKLKFRSAVLFGADTIGSAYDGGVKTLTASINASVQGIFGIIYSSGQSLVKATDNLRLSEISPPKFIEVRSECLSAELKFRGSVLSAMNAVGLAYEAGGRWLAEEVKISAVGIFGISEDISLAVENNFYEFGLGASDGAREGRKLAFALYSGVKAAEMPAVSVKPEEAKNADSGLVSFYSNPKNLLFAYNSWLINKAAGINDVIMRFPEGMAETLGLADLTGAITLPPRITGLFENAKDFGARQLAVWRCRMDMALCPSAIATPEVAVETIDAGIIKNTLKNVLKEMSARAAETATSALP